MAKEDEELYGDFDPNDYRTESGDADFASGAEGFLSDSMMLGGAFDSLITTGAEKAAEERAKGAQAAADSEFKLKKARAQKNDAIVEGLDKDIFGHSEEEIYKRLLEEAGYSTGDAAPAPPPSHAATTKELLDAISGGAGAGSFEFDASSGQLMWVPSGTGQPAPAPAGRETPMQGNGQVHGNTPSGRKFAFDQPAEVNKKAIAEKAKALYEAEHRDTLPGQLEEAFKERSTATETLTDALRGIERVDFGSDEGWYTGPSKAKRSKADLAAQKQAQGKLWGLTDTKETAEEKLMRELARRSMEADLRGQREAQAQNLKERGVYGSGAEVAGFLGTQQELAQRRALEEMKANQNAQQRALAALGQYQTGAFKAGDQSIAEGTQQNLTEQFNAGQKKDYQVAKSNREAAENEAEAKRNATVYDADTNLAAARENKIKDITNAKMGMGNMKIGVGTQGTMMQTSGLSDLQAGFKGEKAKFDNKDASDTEERSWGLL